MLAYGFWFSVTSISVLWTSWFSKLSVFKAPGSKAKEFLNSSLKKHRGCCPPASLQMRPRGRVSLISELSFLIWTIPRAWTIIVGHRCSLRFFGRIDQENSAVIFPFLHPVRGENVQETKLWGPLREFRPWVNSLFLMRPLFNYAAALSASWEFCGEGGMGKSMAFYHPMLHNF
jgi:hypothetical protein